MSDDRDSSTEPNADHPSNDSSGYEISESDLEQLVYLDNETSTDDATQLMEPEASEDLQRAARSLKFIHNVQHANPNCVDDLAAASISDWLHIEGDMPTRIGRHQILRRLGSGGFGVVFLAFDPELEREVALKVPRVETLINGQTRRRFLRESKTAARLNHPNIATIFEAGTVGPIFYIASEHCPGGSLDDYLKSDASPRVGDPPQSGHLPPLAAAHLIASLAAAVDHAHQRGILHRDIKPSNVLLDMDPADQLLLKADVASWGIVAKLVDFGLAKHMGAGEDGTKSGVMLGTPAYAAPEMVIDRENAGVAADVYSLGATLFNALTGQAPLKKATDFETLLAAQREEVKAPSRLVRSIPPDLDAICLKCLEKSPSDRYASAAALAVDLNAFIQGRPVLARRATALERTNRWCRRNAALATMIALATVLLLTSGSAILYALQIVRSQSAYSARLETMREDANMRRLLDQARTRFVIDRPATEGTEPPDNTSVAYRWVPHHDWMVATTEYDLQVWDYHQPAKLATLEYDQVAFAISEQFLLMNRRRLTSGNGLTRYELPNLIPLDGMHAIATDETSATAAVDRPADQEEGLDQQLETSSSFCVLPLDGNTLQIQSFDAKKTIGVLPFPTRVSRFALCQSTGQLAVGLPTGVEIYDAVSTRRLATVQSIQARGIAFSPSGDYLVIASNAQVTTMRTRDWKTVFVAPLDAAWDADHGTSLSSRIAMAEDNGLLAVQAAAQFLHLFRLTSGELVTKVEIPDADTLVGVGFSTNGDTLIAGTKEGTVFMWDLPWLDEHLRPLMNEWEPLSQLHE